VHNAIVAVERTIQLATLHCSMYMYPLLCPTMKSSSYRRQKWSHDSHTTTNITSSFIKNGLVFRHILSSFLLG